MLQGIHPVYDLNFVIYTWRWYYFLQNQPESDNRWNLKLVFWYADSADDFFITNC